MKRIIIDCDPGNGIAGANVDDGLAIALALSSPSLSLELITTVAGNTPCDVGFDVARDLLQRLNRTIPVRKGATQALQEPPAPWREVLDNRVRDVGLDHLWEGVRRPAHFTDASEEEAADAIGKLICDNPGEITVVAIGPLTNIALALDRYPAMAQAVQEIVIMGGVFALDDYIKDTNFGVDPEAAHRVLNSGASLTLVPMDVTTQTLMTHHDLDTIATGKTPLCDFIVETFRPWMDYSIKTRRLEGCWIHDALVVAWLLDREVATAAAYFVDIEIREGRIRGKSWRYQQPLRLSVGIEEPVNQPATILTQVDNTHLITLITAALTAE